MTEKETYSANVAAQKAAAEADRKLKDKIEGGQARAAAYKSNWTAVDLNEIISRFAPGSVPRIDPKNGDKCYYQTPGSPIVVIADFGGGYCRIQDTSARTKKPLYLDVNGNNGHNYTDENGKTHGRTNDEYNRVTHFRIKKVGE